MLFFSLGQKSDTGGTKLLPFPLQSPPAKYFWFDSSRQTDSEKYSVSQCFLRRMISGQLQRIFSSAGITSAEEFGKPHVGEQPHRRGHPAFSSRVWDGSRTLAAASKSACHDGTVGITFQLLLRERGEGPRFSMARSQERRQARQSVDLSNRSLKQHRRSKGQKCYLGTRP